MESKPTLTYGAKSGAGRDKRRTARRRNFSPWWRSLFYFRKPNKSMCAFCLLPSVRFQTKDPSFDLLDLSVGVASQPSALLYSPLFLHTIETFLLTWYFSMSGKRVLTQLPNGETVDHKMIRSIFPVRHRDECRTWLQPPNEPSPRRLQAQCPAQASFVGLVGPKDCL